MSCSCIVWVWSSGVGMLKMKLLSYRSICIWIFIYVTSWVVAERMRLDTSGRNVFIWEGFWILYTHYSSLPKEPAKVGWVSDKDASWTPRWDVSAAGKRPRADPGQTGEITSLGWPVFIILVYLFQLFYSENDPDWFHHVNPAQIITWYYWKLRDTRVERMAKEKGFVLWIKAAGCIEEKHRCPC